MDQQKFNTRLAALNQAVQVAVEESRVEYLENLRGVLCVVLEMFVKDVQKDSLVRLHGKGYITPNQKGRTGAGVLVDEGFVDFITKYWGKGLKQSDLSEVLGASQFSVILYEDVAGFYVSHKG